MYDKNIDSDLFIKLIVISNWNLYYDKVRQRGKQTSIAYDLKNKSQSIFLSINFYICLEVKINKMFVNKL